MFLKDELQKLDWRDFEDLIHDVLEIEGFTVEYRSGIGSDQGRDIIASSKSFNKLENISRRYLVQCKKRKRNIAERDLPNIQNKITEHNCNGYLLVVSSDITENVNKMIDRFKSQGISCNVWRPRDFVTTLINNSKLIQKYFPDLDYKTDEITDDKLIRLFTKSFGRVPSKIEMSNYRNFVNIVGIRDLDEIRAVIDDHNIRKEIDEIYKKELKREGDPVGYFIWGYFYRTLPPGIRTDFIVQKLRESNEYRSKIRFLYDIDVLNPPVSKIEFNAINQGFYNWRTYHEDFKNGFLEVKKTEGPDLWPSGRSYFEIYTPNNECELRLLFLENINLPNKKILNIDLLFEGFFRIFLFIHASDNKLYYIEYIYGDGDDKIISEDGGIEYVQIYFKDFYENGPFLRFDRNFADDFKKAKNLEILKLINVYFSIKGNLKVFYAIID